METQSKRAERNFLLERIKSMAEDASLWQLRKLYNFCCTYFGYDK